MAATTMRLTLDVPVVAEGPISWQHFLYFRPLPQ